MQLLLKHHRVAADAGRLGSGSRGQESYVVLAAAVCTNGGCCERRHISMVHDFVFPPVGVPQRRETVEKGRYCRAS